MDTKSNSINVAVPSTAGAYAAGQIVGGLLAIGNAAQHPGTGVVLDVTLADNAKQDQALDVVFFNGMPEQGGESFRDVYKEISSGRFDLEGDVSDWVTVPNNEASYGQTETNQDMTRFIGDSADYVLNQLIDTTIAKDRDFLAWRAEHPTETVAKANGAEQPGTAPASVDVRR